MTYYQVGGSLNSSNPSYVARKADLMLYQALMAGEFCYVFNARQMGKSSLRIRTKHRLEKEGFTCASVDLTRIGSENITPQQWYKSLVADLLKSFKLFRKVKLKSWWQEHEDRSNIQILGDFIEEVIFQEIQSEKIFIFIDEIDSILSLKFSVDDFFALIRYCYNQRAENPDYNRLTFALFGVTTPSDLIQDKTRTPFNIGKAIELQGFQWKEDEIRPLAAGLEGYVDKPILVLKEILSWTEGQPFLTQKVCQIIVQNRMGSQQSREIEKDANHDLDENLPIANPQFFKLFNKFSTSFIKNYVRSHIIESWETKDEPEHLRTIRDYIVRNEKRARNLLELYQKILQNTEISLDTSREQLELLLSGLVVKKEGSLQPKNRIYQEVFNEDWVKQELSKLKLNSKFPTRIKQKLQAWLASEQQDQSLLLQGEILKEAHQWGENNGLSSLDYQYLIASLQQDYGFEIYHSE